MPDTVNGKVTLAIISTQLTAVLSTLREHGDQLRAIQSCQDQWKHIPNDVDGLKKTIVEHGEAITAAKTRVDNIGVFNGFLAIVAGSIGSLFNPKV